MGATEDAFEAYKEYLTIRGYFLGQGGLGRKDRISADAFNRRRDRLQFSMVAKAVGCQDIREFFVSVCLKHDGKMPWIGEAASRENLEYHHARIGRVSALEYNFKVDVAKIATKTQSFDVRDWMLGEIGQGKIPPVAQLVIRSEICLETFVVLMRICDLYPHYRDHECDGILWPKFVSVANKYGGLLRADVKGYARKLRSYTEN